MHKYKETSTLDLLYCSYLASESPSVWKGQHRHTCLVPNLKERGSIDKICLCSPVCFPLKFLWVCPGQYLSLHRLSWMATSFSAKETSWTFVPFLFSIAIITLSDQMMLRYIIGLEVNMGLECLTCYLFVVFRPNKTWTCWTVFEQTTFLEPGSKDVVRYKPLMLVWCGWRTEF